MANNIAQLKADIRTAFTNNLDATTRTKLANRFVTAYPNHWQVYLNGGGTDTAANRGIFASERLFDYLQGIYRGESYKENIAAIPPPETIE